MNDALLKILKEEVEGDEEVTVREKPKAAESPKKVEKIVVKEEPKKEKKRVVEEDFIEEEMARMSTKESMKNFLLVTTETTKKDYELIGAVRGSSIETFESINKFNDDIRKCYKGEKTDFENVLESARDNAIQIMVSQAMGMGADAVIGVNFQTCDIMGEMVEFLVTGTAVKFRR